MTRVEWSDDSISILLSRVCSLISTGGHARSFPQRGFVGRASTSSLAIDLSHWSLRSLRLRPLPDNPAICSHPLWRLTYEWETSQPPPSLLKSGRFSVFSGSGKADGGEEGSAVRIRTIST